MAKNQKADQPKLWINGKEVATIGHLLITHPDGSVFYEWSRESEFSSALDIFHPQPAGLRKPKEKQLEGVWCKECQKWWGPDSLHAAGIYEGSLHG